MIYIGAEEIVSPLGQNTEENFRSICENRSGIALVAHAGFGNESVYLSKLNFLSEQNKFKFLLIDTLSKAINSIDHCIISSEKPFS